VCTENLIRIEPVKESPHGGGDGRAHPPGFDTVSTAGELFDRMLRMLSVVF